MWRCGFLGADLPARFEHDRAGIGVDVEDAVDADGFNDLTPAQEHLAI